MALNLLYEVMSLIWGIEHFQGPSDPKVQMDVVAEGAFALKKQRACGFIPAPGAFPPVCFDVREQKIHLQRELEILYCYPDTKVVNPRCLFPVNSSKILHGCLKDSFITSFSDNSVLLLSSNRKNTEMDSQLQGLSSVSDQ